MGATLRSAQTNAYLSVWDTSQTGGTACYGGALVKASVNDLRAASRWKIESGPMGEHGQGSVTIQSVMNKQYLNFVGSYPDPGELIWTCKERTESGVWSVVPFELSDPTAALA